MSGDGGLQVRDVSKAYPRWERQERTVRGFLSRRVTLHPRETRWALRHVSVDVAPGASCGLIGANGSGKSTLLRLAAGVGVPSEGRISGPPDRAAVLSLGDTLNLELTGTENAVTGAMLAGIPRRRALELLPRIFEWAELERFAEAPVRTYSDGMKLRLAFGVIAQLQPDLLLLDEVIAVGDLRFQDKCVAHIEELRARGTSFLLASHDLERIAALCDHALWLDGGVVRQAGPAEDVVEAFRSGMRSETRARTPAGPVEDGLELRRTRFGSQEATVSEVALDGRPGRTGTQLEPGGELEVSCLVTPYVDGISDPIVGVSLHAAADGATVCDVSTWAEGVSLGRLESPQRLRLVLGPLELVPGEYYVDIGVWKGDWAYGYDHHHAVYPVRVVGSRYGGGVYRPAGRRWDVSA